MKRLLFISGIFFLLSTGFNTTPHTFENRSQAPAFTDNETIVYKIYYNWGLLWMSAGEVTFNVKENENDFHLVAKGRTYKSYEWFFKVDDTYESWINKETLYPKKSVRDVNEGDYELYDKVVFDQDNNKAVSYRGDNADKTKKTTYDLSDNMHDILSLIYYTRSLSTEGMSVGDKIPLKMFMDKKELSLSMTYKGMKKNKKIRNNGRKDLLLFEPELLTGDTFKEGDKMKLWVSDNSTHLPYMIESPLSVGSIKVVLKSTNSVKL